MPTLEELKSHALGLMQDKGFPISEEIALAVDDTLPYMGHTTQKDGKPLIVVSKWAHDSGMLMGLLIHEMSHIYRMETHHPSHNDALQNKAVTMVIGNKKLFSFQQEILFTIINSIMDLYADDIFFVVMKGRTTMHADFFLSWIHQPVSGTLEEKQWVNAGYMVSAAFVQANLERHDVPDTDGKVAKGVQEFLSESSPKIVAKFPYFKNLMVNLPEDITEEGFGELLVEYLRNFLTLT